MPLYEPLLNWPKIPPDIEMGRCSSVAVDPAGRAFVLHRGKSPVLVFDRDGSLLSSWGDEHLKLGHSLRIDGQGFIWITDVGHHQVYKFTPEGGLISSLGQKGQPGDTTDRFNQPTDVAISPTGEFYVSDGYGNSRVMKFSADGEFILAWGKCGRLQGEFDTPHSLCLDSTGRVYVADRDNSRIQIFNGEGTFLQEWRYFTIDCLFCAQDDTIYAATGWGNEILRLGPAGEPLESWGGPTSTRSELDNYAVRPPGRFNVAHGLHVDPNGDVYVSEIRARRVQKLIRQHDHGDVAAN